MKPQFTVNQSKEELLVLQSKCNALVRSTGFLQRETTVYWLRVQTVEPDNYIKILTVTYDCMIWGRLFHFFGFQFPHL